MPSRQAFAEAYEYCMGFSRRCIAGDLVDRLIQQYPDLFFQEGSRLVRRQLLREAKAFMKDQEPTSEEDVSSTNQIDLPLGILPGMRPPRTLIVETASGDYEHVCYDAATWADLEAALTEKTVNIDRAIARREDHLRKMDALRIYMEAYPTRTVEEACELMRKATP